MELAGQPKKYSLAISRLKCTHSTLRIAFHLRDAFAEVLSLHGENTTDLRKLLAKIFRIMCCVSKFSRGQASIAENTVKALAAFHGWELTFSQAWSGGQHPQADQHALSAFDLDEYERDALENMLLRRSV